MIYVLSCVIFVLCVLIAWLVWSHGKEREKLLDRWMAKNLYEYKAFQKPEETPKQSAKESSENINDVVDYQRDDLENGLSSDQLIQTQSAYSRLIE